MLSIRRRRGPDAFREQEPFGRSEQGWPDWDELGPILLRSAGIVGIAGGIMVIAAGNTLFTEPVRGAGEQPAPAVIAQGEIAPKREIVAAAAPVAPTEEPASAEMVALRKDVAPEAAVEKEEVASTAPHEKAVTQGGIAVAATPVATGYPLMRFGDFDPPAFAQMPGGSQAPAAPRLARLVALRPGLPPQPESPPSPVAPRPVDTVALSSDRAETETAVADTSDSENASLWEETAAECPRDWLDGSAPDFTDELSAECEPELVLVAPVAAAEGDAEDPALDEALESAAAAHAMKLSGFVARVPAARPDPPPQPIRKVRSKKQRADWPDEPPPNCGAKHAYWHFTDRKKGTKEWYCR